MVAPYHEADIVADESFTEAGTFCSEWEPDQCSFHLIGTDYLGRDLLSRIIYGARTTIARSPPLSEPLRRASRPARSL